MREQFSEKLALNAANKKRLYTINEILKEYRNEGYVLTLRQLYYQLVSRDIILNNAKEYAKLSILLTKGRMAGIVDWESIEDRGRIAKIPYWVTGVKNALDDTHRQYRLDRQEGQDNYIEVCIEKDALSSIFKRVTDEFHIRLMVNKGYSSCSAMYSTYNRIVRAYENGANRATILYFGDHDLSGMDMIRDVEDRVREMLDNGDNRELCSDNMFGVIPVALNMQQIRQYNPPENFAKVTDPRAKDYMAEFGDKSWELDALPPNVLAKLTRDNITRLIDMDLYNEVVAKEAKQKAAIFSFMESYKDDDAK